MILLLAITGLFIWFVWAVVDEWKTTREFNKIIEEMKEKRDG